MIVLVIYLIGVFLVLARYAYVSYQSEDDITMADVWGALTLAAFSWVLILTFTIIWLFEIPWSEMVVWKGKKSREKSKNVENQHSTSANISE